MWVDHLQDELKSVEKLLRAFDPLLEEPQDAEMYFNIITACGIVLVHHQLRYCSMCSANLIIISHEFYSNKLKLPDGVN